MTARAAQLSAWKGEVFLCLLDKAASTDQGLLPYAAQSSVLPWALVLQVWHGKYRIWEGWLYLITLVMPQTGARARQKPSMASAPHHPLVTSMLCPKMQRHATPTQHDYFTKPPVQKQPTLVWKLTIQVGPHSMHPLSAMNPKKGFSRLLLCLQGVIHCSLDAESMVFFCHIMVTCSVAEMLAHLWQCAFSGQHWAASTQSPGIQPLCPSRDRQQHHCMQPHQILKNTAGNDMSCFFLQALPLPVWLPSA